MNGSKSCSHQGEAPCCKGPVLYTIFLTLDSQALQIYEFDKQHTLNVVRLRTQIQNLQSSRNLEVRASM